MGQIIATLSEMRSGQVKVPLDTRTKIIVTPDAMQCEIVGKLFDPGKTFPPGNPAQTAQTNAHHTPRQRP